MTKFNLTEITVIAILFYGFIALFSPDVSFNVDLVWKALLFVIVLDIILSIVEKILDDELGRLRKEIKELKKEVKQ